MESKKSELLELALKKLKKFTKSELVNFLDETKTTQNILQKSKSVYCIHGYNNAKLGRKEYGGDKYIRAQVTCHNNEGGNEITISLKYYVPSGYGDGNIHIEDTVIMLTPKEIATINKIGFNSFMKERINLKTELDHNTQCPYTI